MRDLTAKQERFVEEYLVSLNASDAARKSGYSAKTARSIGHENLTKPDIQKALAKRKAAVAERAEISAVDVLQELAQVAFAKLSDFVEWGPMGITVKESADIPPELLGAVQEVSESTSQNGRTTKIKLQDKLKALALLAQYLGLTESLAPKVQINVITGVPRLSHPPPKTLPVIDVEKMDSL